MLTGSSRDDALEHIGQPGQRIDVVQPGGLEQRSDDRPMTAAAVGTVERAMRPVALSRNYARLGIMRRCCATCAASPVDRAVPNALLATNCT